MPPALAPFRAPLARPTSTDMARAFGASKPQTYDPLRVLTHTVPKAAQKHAAFAGSAVVALKVDDSELGKTVLEKTTFKPSTIGAGVGVAMAFLPFPVPNWMRELGIDLALGCGFAKLLRPSL